MLHELIRKFLLTYFLPLDGKHCVDIAKQEFKTKGLDIQAWVTYSYEENYTDAFVVCDGFDKRYQIGKLVYYRLVLWTEEYM